MVTQTELTAGDARLVVVPELGGGIARLDVGARPVLRPWNGDATNPFTLACNVLVPFSNRISNGGFEWQGQRYDVRPNLAGEACPIHGDGFQRPWQVEMIGSHAKLSVADGTIGPWRYAAEQTLELSESDLRCALTVTNTGQDALPFGGGFHPWFPRSASTRLQFQAQGVWMENDRYLPTGHQSLSDAPEWSFATARNLPDQWINNGFTGWPGAAHIFQGETAKSCRVSASANLSTAIVFSPSGDADFFCFEPVSHPVDAFHLEGTPGLVTLQPRESVTFQMTIAWDGNT